MRCSLSVLLFHSRQARRDLLEKTLHVVTSLRRRFHEHNIELCRLIRGLFMCDLPAKW
jgi:hypothetical protein